MTGAVIDQVVFDNEQGIRIVAASTNDRTAHERWFAWMRGFVRLEPYDGIGPPGSALSYFLMAPGEAAVLYRWLDPDGSPGRNPSRALIGPADVLTVPVALGLATWPEWQMVQRHGGLPTLGSAVLTEAAAQSVEEIHARLRQDVEPLTRVVAGMLHQPYDPISVIGASPDQAVALMWGLHGIAESLDTHHESTRSWTFSTYEHDHRSTVAGLPDVVFLPALPRAQGDVRRVVVQVDRGTPPAVPAQTREAAATMVHRFLGGRSVVETASQPQYAGTAGPRPGERTAEASSRVGAGRQEPFGQGLAPADGMAYDRPSEPQRAGRDPQRAGAASGSPPPANTGSSTPLPAVVPTGGGSRPGRPSAGGSGLPWASTNKGIIEQLLGARDTEAFTLALSRSAHELRTSAGRDKLLRQQLDPAVVDELAAVVVARLPEGDRKPAVRKLLQAALGEQFEDVDDGNGQTFVIGLIENCRSPSMLPILLDLVRGRLARSSALSLAVANALLRREGLDPVDPVRMENRRQTKKVPLLRRPLSGSGQRVLWITVMVLAVLLLLVTFWLGVAVGGTGETSSDTGPGASSQPARPGGGAGGTSGGQQSGESGESGESGGSGTGAGSQGTTGRGTTGGGTTGTTGGGTTGLTDGSGTGGGVGEQQSPFGTSSSTSVNG